MSIDQISGWDMERDKNKRNSSAKGKVLVTGATGFLGCNIVHELVRLGWDVRASGMHGSDEKYINQLAIEIVSADITKPDEVDRIVEGCRYVLHVAGDTSFWNKRFALQRQINIQGTMNVARACLKHGVERMVHTSTGDVLGYNPTGGSVDERSGHYNFHSMEYNYGDSKLEAELQLRGFAEYQGLDVVYIYPGFMIGPFDYTLQIGRVFFDLKEGKLPGFPPGGGSFCHVTEVAKAHISALENGRVGEAYLCAGLPETNLSYADMFSRMAYAVNAKPPRFTIPRSLFVAYGYACEFLSRFTKKAPEINPGQARYMSCPQYYLSYKAMRELGYKVPSVEVCIEDALEWYRSKGFDV